MSIVLSNRQLPMLEALHGTDFMTIDEAQAWDQRAFKSMLVREYASYKPGKGFHITQKGRDSRNNFYSTDILRKDRTRPLTSYFDPTAYGLQPARKKREPKAKKEPSKNGARKDNVREILKAQGAA